MNLKQARPGPSLASKPDSESDSELEHSGSGFHVPERCLSVSQRDASPSPGHCVGSADSAGGPGAGELSELVNET